MMREINCNQMLHVTVIWMMDSDSILYAIHQSWQCHMAVRLESSCNPPVMTVPYGSQTRILMQSTSHDCAIWRSDSNPHAIHQSWQCHTVVRLESSCNPPVMTVPYGGQTRILVQSTSHDSAIRQSDSNPRAIHQSWQCHTAVRLESSCNPPVMTVPYGSQTRILMQSTSHDCAIRQSDSNPHAIHQSWLCHTAVKTRILMQSTSHDCAIWQSRLESSCNPPVMTVPYGSLDSNPHAIHQSWPCHMAVRLKACETVTTGGRT